MKRESILVWSVSILSILILAVLVIINQQQTYKILESKDANKKPDLSQSHIVSAFAEENDSNDTLFDFPLNEEDMSTFFSTSKTMYINASSLNVRTGPSTTFDIVKTLFMGDEVIVGDVVNFKQFDYGEDDTEWVAVQSGEAFGFVHPDFLSEDVDSEDGKAISSDNDSDSNQSTNTDQNDTTSKLEKNQSNPSYSNNDSHTSSNETESSQKDEPDITTHSRKETQEIKFNLIEEPNPNLPKGTVELITEEKNGILTIYYKDTFKDGKLIKSEETGRETTKKPINKVVYVRTKVEDPEVDEKPVETEK